MVLIRTLHQLRRSQEYWSLSSIPFEVADSTVADLKGLRDDLLTAELDSRENQGRNYERINDLPFVLSKSSNPSAFADFLTKDASGTHSICFSIRAADFIHAEAGLLVTDVKIDIPKIKSKDNTFTVDLVHSGRAMLRDKKGKARYYTHRPRTTTITWGAAQTTPPKNLLGGDKKAYASLSPFTVWKLSMGPSANVGLDLTDVEEVNLTFNGYHLPFDAA